jgi:hypothetical protein
MLSRNSYSKEYVAECRAKVAAQVSAYKKLAKAAKNPAAIEQFEPVFFNNMVIVLDTLFVHRARTMEGKDGNPLNEVRMLVNSMMLNGDKVAADTQIKLDPAKSILQLKVGDPIRLTESDFSRLAKAFFTEIERKFP